MAETSVEYRRVLAALTDAQEELSNRAVEAIREELSSYAEVDIDMLHDSTALNLQRAILTLESGSVPEVGDAESRETTRRRMDVHVPMGDIIRAYRISLSVIHEAFLAEASQQGMSLDLILDGSHLLWHLGDWFVAGAAVEFRERTVHNEVNRVLRKAELVRFLIASDPWPAGVEDELREEGLATTGNCAVVIRAGGDATTAEDGASRSRPGELTAEIDGWVVTIQQGKDAQPIRNIRHGSVAARGPTVPLRQAAASFAVAARVLNAIPLGGVGLYEVADVGWRLLLPADEVLREVLRDLYVRPLLNERGEGREFLEAVRAYLAHGQNVRRAADSLHVHPNTVRYRLMRFEELTRKTVGDPHVVVDLSVLFAEWV